jgi:hypothetical protein
MSQYSDFLRCQFEVNSERRSLQAMQRRPIKNRENIKVIKGHIQALTQAGRNILTTMITDFGIALDTPDKNKYKSYASQIEGIYKMYKGTSDYGSELLGGCLDMRVALIAGEGVSLSSENKKTQEYLDKFAEKNDLQGSRLIRMVETGELEGKNLLIMMPDKKNSYIKVRSFSWHKNHYIVKTLPDDYELIKEITYTGEDKKPQTINLDKAVYVRLGGCEADVNEATNRLHRVLTDFENLSRSKYDLHKNTRLFGKVIPTWETKEQKESASIKKEMEADDFDIGHGFVGTAKMGLLEPSGNAAAAIEKDILLSLKCISTATGIPIHWLAFPELMSNRATAENLMEIVMAATKKDRLIWEEKLHELIEKSMTIAIDATFEDNSIIDDFTVQLPFVSLEMLSKIIEVYFPLYQDDIISKTTLRDTLPLGLNPQAEDKQIAKEKADAGKNSPLQNTTAQETLAVTKNLPSGAQPPETQQAAGNIPPGLD